MIGPQESPPPLAEGLCAGSGREMRREGPAMEAGIMQTVSMISAAAKCAHMVPISHNYSDAFTIVKLLHPKTSHALAYQPHGHSEEHSK
jgi:hypothetical protein